MYLYCESTLITDINRSKGQLAHMKFNSLVSRQYAHLSYLITTFQDIDFPVVDVKNI